MSFQKLSPEILRRHKGISFTGITTVFYCHDGQGNLFLAKRSAKARDEHGRWDAGGGGLKHGSSVLENLKRELKEEYGVSPKKVDFICWYDAFRTNQDGLKTHWLALNFACQVDPAKVKIMEPEMFSGSGWFKLDKLPTPLHSQFAKFLSLYKNDLQKLISANKTKLSLEDLTREINEFRDRRDWRQFHNPKDLAISLSLEAAELLELFQWKKEAELSELTAAKQTELADELADILYYVILIAGDLNIDIIKAGFDKLSKNKRKYPVSKAKGSRLKYNEL